MHQINFHGQVAVVTGAAGGIGSEYCRLLASRGASVVINDLGESAEHLARQIRNDGGVALASSHSVATQEGGAALVAAALDEFGRVDMLIHNAGNSSLGHFAEQSLELVRQTIDVHLMAAWYVGQPVWRAMEKQNSGRILLTTSMAQFGHGTHPAYAAAKAGLTGLVKSLAHEASMKNLDIKINAIAPFAGTAMSSRETLELYGELISPSNVVAVGAYLLGEECAVSGEVLQAGGSHFARTFFGQTAGWKSDTSELTPEQVATHISAALDTSRFEIPNDVVDGMNMFKKAVLGPVAQST